MLPISGGQDGNPGARRRNGARETLVLSRKEGMVVMPVGGFLDSLPAMLFIGAHVVFLLVGLRAVKAATDAKGKYAPAFWLYVL